MKREIERQEPDYIFETSWEICNKVGGIYTVIATKAVTLKEKFGDRYVLIGPDVLKEAQQNPDFIEDRNLFSSWREKAAEEGLRIRIGRWNIEAMPTVVLVDFTALFQNKDEILGRLWEDYKLDSLSGQWDYIEPTLFGYAAAKVIESFYNFFLSSADKIIAQFHEWMTGAGVLYLKKSVPQAGTIFTTHATVLGRSLAGNGISIYKDIEKLDSDKLAEQFGVVSKYSLEKLSAQNADSFTTVSNITSKECAHFLKREVDVVTANGFEDSFVPDEENFKAKRKTAREKLIKVAEAVMNQKVDKDALLVVNSGRFEYKNKGIDLFIDALDKLKKEELPRQLVAFIAVPAHHSGFRQDVRERLGNPDLDNPLHDQFLTHNLFDPSFDPILNRLRSLGFDNSPDSKVKIIYMPAYLDGRDGIVDLEYYDALIGFDLSVFPSYYEPWGYTPLESIAFHVPTITTTLAGFGLWVRDNYGENQSSVLVVDRMDENDTRVVKEMAAFMHDFCKSKPNIINKVRKEAFDISRIALWKNLIVNYYDAYSVAVEKSLQRFQLYKSKPQPVLFESLNPGQNDQPCWKKVMVKPVIPDKLMGLYELARNLWWSWNCDACELFESIDPELWERSGHNPITLLETLNLEQLKQIGENKDFLAKLKDIYSRFTDYMSQAEQKSDKQIAYFSMEVGIHELLRTYSGGLGILAGDYLKEASDQNKNIVGVSLLYRYGYFQQSLSAHGEQISSYLPQRFAHLPIEPVRDDKGEWIKISVALPGRNLYAKAWRVNVGRIQLYLLDADITDNNDSERFVTHQLYGGDDEVRLKQELLLGIGGIRMLQKLGLDPDIYHCNEGHSAFIGIERLKDYMEQKNIKFETALELVRSSTLFTTHTPVPAGHDVFSEDLLRTYIPQFSEKLNISWDELMNLGRMTGKGFNNKFSMSVLALKLSQEINGVSEIHGRVSREMFSDLFPGYYPEEIDIKHVTNGVHFETWTAKQWQSIYRDTFGEQKQDRLRDHEKWAKIHDVDNALIWKTRKELKHSLYEFLRERVEKDMTHRQEDPKTILKTLENLHESVLTIGFARRFATYKRAGLLFKNLDRLSEIVNDDDRPVMFVFAGKAHPRDVEGQKLISRIIEISKMPRFIGKIVFVENYNMAVGRKLVQGVDLWLNTPTRPLEASGTSGEKAIMNGVLNFSVLDGWWAEGYKPGTGWAIREERTYDDQNFQDELDAETIYNTLENEIVTSFYDRDKNDIPVKWIQFIKNNIAEVAPKFTMTRMMDDYFENHYSRLFDRIEKINVEGNVSKLADWKRKVIENWDDVYVETIRVPDSTIRPLGLGDTFVAEITLNTAGLDSTDLGVEIIFGQKENDIVRKISFKESMKNHAENEGKAVFRCEIPFVNSGVWDYAFRIYPSNPLLTSRMDFPLVKWA